MKQIPQLLWFSGWGCEVSWFWLTERLREPLFVEVARISDYKKNHEKMEGLRSRINNQYIYYLIIKNTGCNIARCSALSLISLVSLSGARSFRKLQTNKCGQTKYWISILDQLHFLKQDWSHFCSQLPLGSGSVKSFCEATSRGHQVKTCAHTQINNPFAQKFSLFSKNNKIILLCTSM